MKKKLVLWGTGANEEKLLLAIELVDTDNTVKIHSFPESIATETFYAELMENWREGKEIVFPEGHQTIERPLSVTDDILPEEIKVERTDLINRAKAEWHFVVLSSKLYALYQSELEDISARIEKLNKFENAAWEELKGFWAKVQQQSREKNLFRGHAEKLKEETNGLFESLKQLRRKLDKEYQSKSEETKKVFMDKLNDVQEKIDKGLGLSPLFNELKKIQTEFRDGNFTRDDREKVWKKLDAAFKQVKEKRFGNQGTSQGGNSSLERVERRYQGLMSAIGKMSQSISRDQNDIDYQGKIINETDGQLEQQIRQAKVKMIEERISSKNIKLEDMMKTKAQLESKIESLKVREAKEGEKKKINEAKAQVKERIAKEIEDKNKELANDKKVQAAAQSIKPEQIERVELPKEETPKIEKEEVKAEAQTEKKEDSNKAKPKEEESLLSAIATTVSESFEDVVDTVKAVAEVVGDKVEEKIEDIKSDMSDQSESTNDKKSEGEEDSEKTDKKNDSMFGAIASTLGESLGNAVDTAKAVADVVGDKVEEKIADIKADFSGEEE